MNYRIKEEEERKKTRVWITVLQEIQNKNTAQMMHILCPLDRNWVEPHNFLTSVHEQDFWLWILSDQQNQSGRLGAGGGRTEIIPGIWKKFVLWKLIITQHKLIFFSGRWFKLVHEGKENFVECTDIYLPSQEAKKTQLSPVTLAPLT